MSWNFTVEQINRSLERLAQWYQEFMHRAEQSFKGLHDRVIKLEEHQSWKGPSDEQVERVLRKILAERFADPGTQRVENPHTMKEGAFFVKNPKQGPSILQTIPIDVASLHVDPKSIPSKAYGHTLEMLEGHLPAFPDANVNETGYEKGDQADTTSGNAFKAPKAPMGNHQHSRPWS